MSTNTNGLQINSKPHNNILLSKQNGDKQPITFMSGMIFAWNKPNQIPNGWTKCDGGFMQQTVLNRKNKLLNNGHPIPDFRGKMLRMQNTRAQAYEPLTTDEKNINLRNKRQADRDAPMFKGYSSYTRYSVIAQHNAGGQQTSKGIERIRAAISCFILHSKTISILLFTLFSLYKPTYDKEECFLV